MITERDQNILNFLQDFHIATANQIHRVFFPKTTYQYSRKRLRFLLAAGEIKRTRSTIDNSFAYYIDKKPCQIHHDLIRTEIFVAIRERFKVLGWQNEEPIKNIRPDATAYIGNSAFTYIDDNGIVFPVFVEVHLNNKFNFDKYKELLQNNDLRSIYGIMPRVLICTDRQVTVPAMGIKFKVVNFNTMAGLDTLFK